MVEIPGRVIDGNTLYSCGTNKIAYFKWVLVVAELF